MVRTVRKDAQPWSGAVHGVLGWLHEHAPGLAPRPIALDGRDWVVEWVPGAVSAIPFAPFLRATSGMASVGRLLRRAHDATEDYQPAPHATWMVGEVAKAAGDVILHGDTGAGNIVWRDGEAAALIDWEFAEPGPPIRDVALAAWVLVPLVPPAGQRNAGFPDGAPQRERLAALCEGYGRYEADEVLAAYRAAIDLELRRRRELGGKGVQPWARFVEIGQLERIEATAAWFDTNGL